MSDDIEDLARQAKSTIENILYITIATANKKGEPWNSPVYSAYDENYNFYWASYTENQHSKNIRENKAVFIVVYDSTVPEGTGFGVYLKGRSAQLEEKNINEIKKAIKLLYHRKTGKPRKPTEFLGKFPRRIFKFIPEKAWVNSKGQVNGNFVDTRVEITKNLLKR